MAIGYVCMYVTTDNSWGNSSVDDDNVGDDSVDDSVGDGVCRQHM